MPFAPVRAAPDSTPFSAVGRQAVLPVLRAMDEALAAHRAREVRKAYYELLIALHAQARRRAATRLTGPPFSPPPHPIRSPLPTLVSSSLTLALPHTLRRMRSSTSRAGPSCMPRCCAA